MNRLGLIYRAVLKATNECYVGQCIDLVKRQNNHFNKRYDGTKFHNAIIDHGWDAFYWEVLEKDIPEEKLNEREIFWVDYYDSFNNGFNETRGGDYGVKSRDYRHSQELIEKFREQHLGSKLDEDVLERRRRDTRRKKKEKPPKVYKTKEEISEAKRKGWTEEVRRKQSETQKRYWTEEKRQECSDRYSGEGNPMYGKGYKLEGEKNGRYGKKYKGVRDENGKLHFIEIKQDSNES